MFILRMFCILIFCFPAFIAAQSSLEKGVQWYKKRAKGATGIKARQAPINKAIKHLEKAVGAEGVTRKEATFLLKSYYFKGTYALHDNDMKQKVFAKGKGKGEKFKEQYPDHAPILFWYGANLGRWGEAYGVVAAAREGLADKMRKICKKIIALDEQFQGGGGYRVLAQVHFQSPYIPMVLSWPSNEKAIKYMEKALQIAPDNPNNKLQYGKILKYEGYEEKAKPYLEEVASLTPDPDQLLENKRLKKEAKKLLQDY